MVVGIGKILKFNRKCTIVIGLLFAVIFFILIMVPSQADDDGFTDEASGQTTTYEMYHEDTIETYADTLTNVLPTAGIAQAGIITVCSSGCDYTSIQEAIDNANDSDTIQVHSGTYYENVRVNKELTIISESGNPDDTIVQAEYQSDVVFYVTSNNVTINGFKVTGATEILSYAIYLYNVRNCSILNNEISDNWLGIRFSGSSNNTVVNNTISNSGWGIYVGRSSNNNKLNNNSIISNQNGIYLEDTNNHTLNDNNFINNDLGINLDNSSNNNISGNNFAYNTMYGIYLQDSNGNDIYTNNFINNNNNANSSYSINNWNSTRPITYQYNGSTFINYVGNYWSDYTGSDSDSDGIGDTPYEINDSAGLQDEYPLIEPWEGVDLVHPYVTITFPANLATNVKIDTDITATFSEPMDSSTLNSSTVKVYSLDEIVGETFEDTNGSWNSSNFQGFNHSEELTVWQTPIDDTHRTIGEHNLTYTTHTLLRDYQLYSNEGIEVEDSGNYSVIGWLGDENVVIDYGTGDWIISKLVFEQNSNDTKTLHVGETWDLGDGYSFKLVELDKYGKDAWMALNNSSGKIDDEVCQNQSACIFSTDLGASDDTALFVTYLNKVNLAQSHIELKYTWLISQKTSEIQNNEQLGDFRVKTSTDRIIIENDEDMFLMRDSTIPLFYDFKFEVEDTSTVQYSLIYQYHTDTSVDGDISYDSARRTVIFDPVSNLKYDTNYISYITTVAEDLAGNSLIENYEWKFKTMHYTTPSRNGGGGGGGGGTSGEDFYNIVLSETDRQSVFKNSHISYMFDLEDNIVRHINFRALKSTGTVAAKVEILNNTSTLVSTLPPHEVFRNLNIWVGNAGWATERNIDDATVVFTVDKSWITKNNIDESSIALYRYSDDTWHKLVTKKIAENANSLQFEAETPGFSPFAVTGKTIGEPGGEGIIEPTVTAEKTPAPTPTEKKGIPGFSLLAGMSVLLIAVQILRKKK